MNDKKKKINIFKFVFICIFATYTAVFIMVNMGYYEYKNYSKKILTQKQIEKFENDIKNGIELDINEYLVKDSVINKKQISLKISKIIGDISRKSIQEIFKILNKIVET